jgi:hypothetical protein
MRLVNISINIQRRVNSFQTILLCEGRFYSKAQKAHSVASYIVQPIFMAGEHIKLTYDIKEVLNVLGYISDGLSDISESHPELNPPEDLLSAGNHPFLEINDCPAYDAVLGLLRKHPQRSIAYIALGPLTSLAQTLRRDGACVRERIGRVVIMGGALDVPGNATPSAECARYPLSVPRRTY